VLNPQIPPEALLINPSLKDVGQEHPYQELVFAELDTSVMPSKAFLVARLTAPHPEGQGTVGHYYGTILRGFEKRGSFRFFSCVGIGEVIWKDGTWRMCDDVD